MQEAADRVDELVVGVDDVESDQPAQYHIDNQAPPVEVDDGDDQSVKG